MHQFIKENGWEAPIIRPLAEAWARTKGDINYARHITEGPL